MILAIWYETLAIGILAGFMVGVLLAWIQQRKEDKEERENKDGNDD